MNRIFIFSLIFLANISFGATFSGNLSEVERSVFVENTTVCLENVKSVEIIETYDACSVYRIELENGTSLFNVIAGIATVFLPEIAKGVCSLTIGDPDACNAVYDVSSALVRFRGPKIYSSMTKGFKWIANRGVRRSYATVETSYYDSAKNIKKAFELYKKVECINWQSVNLRNSPTYDDYSPTYDGYSPTYDGYSPTYDDYSSKSVIIFSNSPYRVRVWIEGKYIGATSIYYNTNSEPYDCNTVGNVIAKGKPGRYSYRAESDDGKKWEGYIDIDDYGCLKLRLVWSK